MLSRSMALLALSAVLASASLAATPEQIEAMKKEGAKQFTGHLKELEFAVEARKTEYQTATKGMVDAGVKDPAGFVYAEKTGYRFRTAKIKQDYCEKLLEKLEADKAKLMDLKKKTWDYPNISIAKLEVGHIGYLCDKDLRQRVRFQLVGTAGEEGVLAQVGDLMLWVNVPMKDWTKADKDAKNQQPDYTLNQPVEVIEQRMIKINDGDAKPIMFLKPFKLPE
ncbi:MAG: hypothetical protein K2R98_30810 [Gemmataceae bacterium]|nr:hypothetical protein [Gemmataceae bacterium]